MANNAGLAEADELVKRIVKVIKQERQYRRLCSGMGHKATTSMTEKCDEVYHTSVAGRVQTSLDKAIHLNSVTIFDGHLGHLAGLAAATDAAITEGRALLIVTHLHLCCPFLSDNPAIVQENVDEFVLASAKLLERRSKLCMIAITDPTTTLNPAVTEDEAVDEDKGPQ